MEVSSGRLPIRFSCDTNVETGHRGRVGEPADDRERRLIPGHASVFVRPGEILLPLAGSDAPVPRALRSPPGGTRGGNAARRQRGCRAPPAELAERRGVGAGRGGGVGSVGRGRAGLRGPDARVRGSLVASAVESPARAPARERDETVSFATSRQI